MTCGILNIDLNKLNSKKNVLKRKILWVECI